MPSAALASSGEAEEEGEEEEEETRNESERGQKGFSSGGKEGAENDGKRINLLEGIVRLRERPSMSVGFLSRPCSCS